MKIQYYIFNPIVQVLGVHIGLLIKFRVPQKLVMQGNDELRIKDWW